MRHLIAAVAALVLITGCGGGSDAPSTTETPQGAAKLWLQAAIAGNDARVKELSHAEFQAQCTNLAGQIRERIDSNEGVLWGGSGQEGEDFLWTATAPGGTVFLKVRKVGEGDHRVSDASTSW